MPTIESLNMLHTMKNVLITGANRGIGLEHTRAFVARGIHVNAAVRSLNDAGDLQALAKANPGLITLLTYDAANPDSAAQLKAAVGDVPIDLLLANAGAMGGSKQSFGAVDAEDVVQLVRINAVAPLKLAEALADNVAKSDRRVIAFQSSLMGSIGDSSGGHYAYRMSKAALNMVAKGVSNDLNSRGVIVVTMHPGWVRTRMGGTGAPLTVAQSVAGQQQLLDGLTMNDTGHFFNYDGKELPW
jgi:NAD(P)-dependent dehydrogenase (short-subunit alcohol dehydrogenase family)